MYKQFVFITLALTVFFLPLHGQNMAMQAPQKIDSSERMYTLKSGNMTMVIDGNTGSRVISLKLDDDEILGSKNLHSKFYGSTLWLSPEGKWRGQGILDGAFYKTITSGKTGLSLMSQKDSVRGFAFAKQFLVNARDTSISIIYSITNISKDTQSVSPWEVTRVPTGGLAFYPRGDIASLPKSNLKVQDSIGLIWYPYDSSKARFEKQFTKGSEGWSAYVRNDLVFIKQFPLVNSNQTAPGETDVEIYVNKDKTYMELENQGPYKLLEHDATLTYEVKWFVRRLPPGLKVETGSQPLISYIRSVVKKK